MVPLASLWLPILLSAVIVFLASFVLHMALPWHHADYAQVPEEEKARAALRPLGIPPGDYMVPHPTSAEGMRSPDSMREMYAGEQPGKESCRWLRPAFSRAVFRRSPTALGLST